MTVTDGIMIFTVMPPERQIFLNLPHTHDGYFFCIPSISIEFGSKSRNCLKCKMLFFEQILITFQKAFDKRCSGFALTIKMT